MKSGKDGQKKILKERKDQLQLDIKTIQERTSKITGQINKNEVLIENNLTEEREMTARLEEETQAIQGFDQEIKS